MAEDLMIFLVSRPFSGDVIGMTTDELNEYMAIPDNKGLDFKIAMAFPEDNHACEGAQIDVEAGIPLD